MSNLTMKCRKCRFRLLDSAHTPLLSAHHEYVKPEDALKPNPDYDCSRIKDTFFLQENGLPHWIITKVNEECWLRGKLKCPSCCAKLGTFDFITGQMCSCSAFVVPPIHIAKSKVDCCFELSEPSSSQNVVDY